MTNANQINYKAGDVIEYRNLGGELVQVLVEEREANVKNDYPGFSGTRVNDPSRGAWGYDHQITRIVRVS